MPTEVQEQLDAYAARFFVLKTPRKLLWRPDLGAVNLTLTVGEEVLDLTVTPVQAAILMQFRVRPTGSVQGRGRHVRCPALLLGEEPAHVEERALEMHRRVSLWCVFGTGRASFLCSSTR